MPSATTSIAHLEIEDAKRRRRQRKLIQKRKRRRERALKALGFESYKAYMDSELWQEIRKAVFALKGEKCIGQGCSRKAHQVHHSRYDLRTLAGNDLRYLWPVCWYCHDRAEFAPKRMKETKNRLKRANQRLGIDG